MQGQQAVQKLQGIWIVKVFTILLVIFALIADPA